MSWNQLIGIAQEARQIREEDARKPLVDCPVCGLPLVTNSRGVKNCPAGDFRQG